MDARCTGFTSVWIVLFTMVATPGEQLKLLMLSAREIETGLAIELGIESLGLVDGPPYPIDAECLLVTINAVDLAGCHVTLGWRMPQRIIDLVVEFRNATNGRQAPFVGGLAGALMYFGLSTVGASGALDSPEQLRRTLALGVDLYKAMRPSLDLGRALLRGRYLCATARIEATGVPVDQELIAQLKREWAAIRDRVIAIVDIEFGFYSGRQFNQAAFAAWLKQRRIAWPRLAGGQFDLSDETFKVLALACPELRPMRELHAMLSNFQLFALQIGSDGRNRTQLRPFASRTGRNQPSTKASAFGAPAWVRNLIKPHHGTGLAYIDWEQQEFGIAAALSGDGAMQKAYRSGDPYLALAVAATAAPIGATAKSHPLAREQFKTTALGIQYGMSASTLAHQLNCPVSSAGAMLAAHRKTYARYWSWSDSVENAGLLDRELRSVFGWRISVGAMANPRALRNFPVQANGAEMLRLACCLTTERGIRVCAPNHDALLIEAPLDDLDDALERTRQCMAEASAIVLDGFELRTDVRAIRSPDRWTELRGQAIWNAINRAIADASLAAHQRDGACPPPHSRTVLLYVSMEDTSDASH